MQGTLLQSVTALVGCTLRQATIVKSTGVWGGGSKKGERTELHPFSCLQAVPETRLGVHWAGPAPSVGAPWGAVAQVSGVDALLAVVPSPPGGLLRVGTAPD